MKHCNGTFQDCTPESVWTENFLNMPSTKEKIGVAPERKLLFFDEAINDEFNANGDV